jgi:hypothetical protein
MTYSLALFILWCSWFFVIGPLLVSFADMQLSYKDAVLINGQLSVSVIVIVTSMGAFIWAIREVFA